MGQHDKHIRAGTIIFIHLLVLIFLSISISSSTSWFSGTVNQDDFHQTFDYNAIKWCTVTKYENEAPRELCKNTEDAKERPNGDGVVAVYEDSYYLVVSGIVFSVLVVVFTIIPYVLKRWFPGASYVERDKRICWIIVLVFSILAILLDLLAFGLFYRLPSATKAFDDANGGTECTHHPSMCDHIRGKTNTEKWGPSTGLWLCLAAAIFSFCSLILSSRKPKNSSSYVVID